MNESLTNAEIERFSRQLILPEFGTDAQIKLRAKSALIIGCGGLGCPAALYLATSGFGKLGLVDHDTVDLSNLHRQIGHSEEAVGVNKAKNLASQCKKLNSALETVAHEIAFEKSTSMSIIEQYDVILDCTDNLITRYLINDCCALLNKPLVSGGALRFDGQLTVYNYKEGPCMRCIYPKAQPRETVNNCSDVGILGPIVGTIGTLQALEAIKIAAEIGECLNGRLLIFNGLDFMMRVITLRKNKKADCVLCSKSLTSIDSFDYNQFCGTVNYDDKTQSLNLINENERISCKAYKECVDGVKRHLLVDVRPKVEFKMCSLPNSLNVTMEELKNNLGRIEEEAKRNDAESSKINTFYGSKSSKRKLIFVHISSNFGVSARK